MSAQPIFEQIDDYTADLLELVADLDRPIGRDVPALFLDACERCASERGGLVSVNRVRELLTDAGIEHHRYSSMWGAFTGSGKPMMRAHNDAGEPLWEPCKGSPSGNNGRPYPLRRWLGSAA